MIGRSPSPLAALLALLSGCASNRDRIEAEDRGQFFPTLRASIDLDREEPLPLRHGHGHGGLRSNFTFDVDVTALEGETTDRVRSNDDIEFEDFEIEGPADLEIDYDLRQAALGLGASLFFPRGFVITGTVGLAYSSLELELLGGNQSIHETISAIGPAMQGRAAWFPEEHFGLYAQISHRLGFPEEYDAVSIDQFETGLELRPARGLALFGGFRWLSYHGDNDRDHRHADNSELELEISGAVAGLALSF